MGEGPQYPASLRVRARTGRVLGDGRSPTVQVILKIEINDFVAFNSEDDPPIAAPAHQSTVVPSMRAWCVLQLNPRS